MARSNLVAFAIVLLSSSVAHGALVASLAVECERQADNWTRYEYTLLNAAESTFPLDTFMLDTGGNVDMEITAPDGWIVDYGPFEDTFELVFLSDAESALAPGESAVFSLLAAASPDPLPYFLANFARSDQEDGYVIDTILSPSRRYARHPGDTDGDGVVDLADLNNVRNNFGTFGEPVLGDTEPFDGVVNLRDLNQVRNHFGANYNTPVPEPSSLWLGAIGAVVLSWRRMR
jgi:hypothetical protein